MMVSCPYEKEKNMNNSEDNDNMDILPFIKILSLNKRPVNIGVLTKGYRDSKE